MAIRANERRQPVFKAGETAFALGNAAAWDGYRRSSNPFSDSERLPERHAWYRGYSVGDKEVQADLDKIKSARLSEGLGLDEFR